MSHDLDPDVILIMSADQVRAARKQLGQMWGLGRPLSPDELAFELGLGGEAPGKIVVRWERGQSDPSGPCSRLIQALLAGFRPTQLPNQPKRSKRLEPPSRR